MLPTPVEALALSVTAGANGWIRNQATEPIALAAYVDGTVIRTKGFGEVNAPVPTATIGRMDHCRLTALLDEVSTAVVRDLGQPTITDQGDTVVKVRGSDQDTHSVAIYAFGIGDKYVTDDQRANRIRLHHALDAVAAAVPDPQPWTPTRIRLIAQEWDRTAPAHQWHGPGYLGTVLSDLREHGCIVLEDDDAATLLHNLGADPARSSWADGGGEAGIIGTFTVGVLVPGQPDCPRT